MKTIYKYQLKIAPIQKISFPATAQITHFDIQNNTACLWAIIDKEETEIREIPILMFGTGEDIPSELDVGAHFGTLLFNDRQLVFHYFWGD